MAVAELSTIAHRGDAGDSKCTFDSALEIDDPVKPYSNSIQLALKSSLGASRTAPAIQENGHSSGGRELGQASLPLSAYLPRPALQRKHLQARPSLHALQEWEGYVIEIGETEFVARLTDLTANAKVEDEQAVIPLEEISDDDAAKLRLGGIFRWVIGYERSGTGTKKRVSQIVFRDLPVVTKSDMREGEAWARETLRLLNP